MKYQYILNKVFKFHQYIKGNYESNQYYETELRTFKGGYVVGEREFVMNRTYEYNARAVKFTQLALLE